MKRMMWGLMLLSVMISSTLEAKSGSKNAKQTEKVNTVIYMIGDGMGLAQVSAAMLLYEGAPLNLERAMAIGLQKSQSASDGVTDSAASGTALSTGSKTYNGAIAVDTNKQPLTSIRARAAKAGLATGVVATYSIVDATPAAFVAHNESRGNTEQIAEDFVKSDIDLFIGGGRDAFEKRQDGRKLTDDLKAGKFQVAYTLDEVKAINQGKVAGLLSDWNMPSMLEGRGPVLPTLTEKAIEILSNNNPKGFFLMVEGSQIDGGGHANNIDKVVTETRDFDAAVKVAFDYADAHPGTLVVVTADHETGGLALVADSHKVGSKFTTNGHSGIMLPVYAYGTGADQFAGIMDNTDLPKRIAAALRLKW